MITKFTGTGSLVSYKIVNDTLEMTCTQSSAKIKILENGAAHIQMKQLGDPSTEFSYASVENQPLSTLVLVDQGDYILLLTLYYKVIIWKNPFRIDFQTLEDAAILEDDEGLSVQWARGGFTCFKKKISGERIIGMGAKAGPANKTGKKYTCWNTDHFGYGPDSDPLYASIPFYIGIREGIPYGVFLDNSSRSHFDFGASNERFMSFGAESGPLSYYFFHTGDVKGILHQYQSVTGFAPLPPKWSLGFQQCRYSYYPQEDVLKLAQNFRDKNIGGDVIYLDIHYMDAYKVFTWHPEYFTHPQELIRQLNELGFKVVIILDPGVKIEEGYEVYESGLQADAFVKYIDGTPVEGSVWPGNCHFPDFTKPSVRDWWAQYVSEWRKQGISGFWNDMNEPALWGNQFPDASLFDYDGQEATHLEAHNVYGMQMCRSTEEGVRQAAPEERPFLLTRAAFAGSQRYTAIWTGDNSSSADHMLLSARMVSSLGLSGMPFSGADVGGFIGECSAELFKSWIALGAFQPLFRSHTMINSRAAEPWSFGEEATDIARNFIALRYRMLPFWYSLFYQYSQSGIPPVRSMALEHWQLDEVFESAFENQFFLGEDLLICPNAPGQPFSKIYLPPGKWYNFYNDTLMEGNRTHIIEPDSEVISAFIRAGAILPLCSHDLSNTEEKITAIDLHLYGLERTNTFEFYDDDGISLHSKVLCKNFSFDSEKIIVNFSATCGSFSSTIKTINLILHGDIPYDNCLINGKLCKLETTNYRFVNPVTNFDPYEKKTDDGKIIFGVKKAAIHDFVNEINIEFIKSSI